MRGHHRIEAALAALAALVVLLAWLGSGYMPIDNDPLYADVIRTMVRSGNWLDPQIHGVPFLDKPPLYFWLGSATVTIAGVGELALRLPAALAAAMCVGLAVYAARRSGMPGRGAFTTAAALAATSLFVEYARRVYMDVPVALAVFAAIIACTHGIWGIDGSRGRPRYLIVAGVLVGIAFMLKSLVAGFAVLPVLVLVIWQRRWDIVRSRHTWLGVAGFLAIAAPWHIYQLAINRQVFLDFTYKLHVEDQVLSAQPWSTGPLWFYPQMMMTEEPVLGICVLLGLGALAMRRLRRHPIAPLDRLSGLFLVLTLIALSAAETKKLLYLLVIVPPAVLLFARMMTLLLPTPRLTWLVAAAMLLASVRSMPLFAPGGSFLQDAAPFARAGALARERVAPDESIYLLDLYFSSLQYYGERRAISYWTGPDLVASTQRIPYIRYGDNMRHVEPSSAYELITRKQPGIWVMTSETSAALGIPAWAVIDEHAGLRVFDTRAR